MMGAFLALFLLLFLRFPCAFLAAFLALFLLLFLRFPCAFFFAFLALFIASITSLYPSGLLRNLFLRRGWSDQSVRQ